jgi:hypothetical protein
MLRRMKMLGGVFVFGRIAATYMAASSAKAQVYPAVSHFETFLATASLRFDVLHLVKMSACYGHTVLPALLGPAAGQPDLKARLSRLGIEPDLSAVLAYDSANNI